MTQHQFGNSGRYVSKEWHRRREEARTTAMSPDEFGPIESERYDYDTAGITGEANPETYKSEPYGTDKTIDRRDDPLMD